MFRGGKLPWITWIALALYVFIGLAPVRGFVVCIGENGHVGIEAASTNAACSDCSSESVSSDLCCAKQGVQGSGCSCADIPLLETDERPTTITSAALGNVPPAACLGWQPSFAAIWDASPSVASRTRTTLPPRLRLHSTLILRV